MNKKQKDLEKARKNKQKMLNEKYFYMFVDNFLVVVCIIAITITSFCLKIINNDEVASMEYESSEVESNPKNDDYHVTVESFNETTLGKQELQEPTEPIIDKYPSIEYTKDFDHNDEYLLAKIAMAEAEGESLEVKVLVILTVMNRVYSDEFPDTVYDVLFQVTNGTHQFTPIADGRWYKVEPNEECWEALKIAKETNHDYSFGALYFESCQEENWHSRNLTLVCESGNMQFYK